MSRFLSRYLFALISLSCFVSFAQNIPPSDPTAMALAAQSLAAMNGGTALNDVTLSGNATWILGSNPQSGTITFTALGTGESRMDLSFADGSWTEIRDASTGSALGEWISNDSAGQFASHNCWADAAWFFPALSGMVIAPNSNIVLSYIGLESWQGFPANHLQAYVYVPGDGGLIKGLNTIDYYLDPTSHLPIAESFNAHPDNDASTALKVQVSFLAYQVFNGAQVPVHIQKVFNGQLILDANITSVTLNSGLQLSQFAIQ